MKQIYNTIICLAFLSVIIKLVNASTCSRSLPSYNETTFTGDAFTGGIQLLIPSWTFSCKGTIDQWYAHVTGNTTIDNSIEFQVFKPDSIKDNVYHVVYGNSYKGDNSDHNRINVTTDNVVNVFLPIRAGYIVGVYIRPDIMNQLHLLYEDTGDVDIYYWENVTERDCDLSLCNAKIIKGVNPLIGWIFRDASETLLQLYEGNLALIRQTNPNYCSEAQVPECILPTTTIESSPFTFVSSTISSMSGASSTHIQIISPHTTRHSTAAVTNSWLKSSTESIITPSTSPTNFWLKSSTESIITPSTSPTTSSQQLSQLQLILIAAVIGLFVLSLFLAVILSVLLLLRCSRRLGRKKMSNVKQNRHVSTGVNPCYRMHTVLGMEETIPEDSNRIYYEPVDATKNLYYEVKDVNKSQDVQDYCEPEPFVKVIKCRHTYDNIDDRNRDHIYNSVDNQVQTYNNMPNQNIYHFSHIYEDTDTL